MGDHVYVIEASAADEADTDDPEEHGWPLVVHRRWVYVVTVATDETTEIKEVPGV